MFLHLLLETFLLPFAVFAVHMPVIISMLASYVSNIRTFAMQAVYKGAGTNDLSDGYFCGGLAVSTFNGCL